MPSPHPVRTQLPLFLTAALSAGILIGAESEQTSPAPTAPGATRVARWKDDKQAAILLMFDDSSPSHVKNVVPELKKRGFVGTFYVNPGTGHWKAMKNAWEKDIPASGMEYGNHTMTHQGVRDMADAEQEIRQSNEIIQRLFPGTQPRLISWGLPGVKKGAWNITEAQLNELLAKYHLIARPTFDQHGAVIHFKTADDLARLLDRVLASGGSEYVIFHGVGGDWIVFPQAEFVRFLDRLAAKADQVWVAGHIAAHKYQTERDAAEVRVLEASDHQIRLELKSRADAKLYDGRLTLVTRVPAGWKQCQIVQGTSRQSVAAREGAVRYDALPNGPPIRIEPLAK